MRTALATLRRLSLLGAAVLIAAAPALAQDRASTVEITPFAGGYFGGTLDAGSNAVFDRDVEVGTDLTYGLRLGFQFNNWVGMEVGAALGEGEIKAPTGDPLFGTSTNLGTFKSQNYHVNGVFNMMKGRFVPYFTIGAGMSRLKMELPRFETDWDERFTSNAGFGLKIWVTPQFGFKFDGRFYATYIGDGEGCDDYYDYCDGYYYYDDGIWYTSGEATVGVTVAF